MNAALVAAAAFRAGKIYAAPLPHYDVTSANTARWPARNAFLSRKGIIGKAVLRQMNRDGIALSPSPSVNLVAKLNALRRASTSILFV